MSGHEKASLYDIGFFIAEVTPFFVVKSEVDVSFRRVYFRLHVCASLRVCACVVWQGKNCRVSLIVWKLRICARFPSQGILRRFGYAHRPAQCSFREFRTGLFSVYQACGRACVMSAWRIICVHIDPIYRQSWMWWTFPEIL